MTTPEHFRDRYIDELIGAAVLLDSIESAAIAEAWASGAVAEWLALDGTPGRLAGHIRAASPVAAELIEWIDAGTTPAEHPGLDVDWLADVGRHDLTRAVQLRQPKTAGPECTFLRSHYRLLAADRVPFS